MIFTNYFKNFNKSHTTAIIVEQPFFVPKIHIPKHNFQPYHITDTGITYMNEFCKVF